MPKPDAFDNALRLTLGYEGGKADVPGDRGGLTMRGVTQANYDRWRHRKGLKTRPVTMIEDGELRDFYLTGYWQPAHCHELPDHLAACVFDAAVHHGPVRAIMLLQKALGVAQVGNFGPLTRAAVKAADESVTIAFFLDARNAYMDAIVAADPTQAKFRKGWLNRVASLRNELLNERTA